MLFFVCSPIGNLNDISIRSIDALNECSMIFCEDTRKSNLLLKHHDIHTDCVSFHEHNETTVIPEIIELLKDNKTICILSDAGAPMISDPGYKLVQRCIEEDIEFTVLPGPSSLINAVLMCGLPSEDFIFFGFIPRKEKQKIKFFKRQKNIDHTLVFFDSIKRLQTTIEIMHSIFGPKRKIAICREMTKDHEEIIRGDLESILQRIVSGSITLKGEIVIVVERIGTDSNEFALNDEVRNEVLKKLSPSEAAKLISLMTNHKRRDIYDWLKKS